MRGAPGSGWDAKGLSYVGSSVHTVLREYNLDVEYLSIKVPGGTIVESGLFNTLITFDRMVSY